MKRILLLVNKRKFKTKRKIIAVAGVSPKAGVTHLSLCLANFIKSALRQKVIYVELRKDSQLLGVVGMNQVKIGETYGYLYKGVKYVLTDDVDEVLKLTNKEKAWFIIDMESLEGEYRAVYTNSDNKILIGSLSPWCQREYNEFIENNIKNKNDINRIMYYTKNKNKTKEFNKSHGCTIKELPFINDPFSLKEENFDALIEMLQ